MTVLDDRHQLDWNGAWSPRPDTRRRPVVRPGRQRPGLNRPAVASLQYRGSGVVRSWAPSGASSHGWSCAQRSRRPVSTTVTIALAGLAALITLWLGALAQSGAQRAVGATSAPVPDRLAVVEIHAGETLQQLAGRIAPDVPVLQTVERIRDLNKLDSASLTAGRTLIAPVG
jgi:hypothetical protein